MQDHFEELRKEFRNFNSHCFFAKQTIDRQTLAST